MTFQLLHVASGFALHAMVLRQMEPGMHYLQPATRALRQRMPMLAGLSDRSLLLCWYTLVGGVEAILVDEAGHPAGVLLVP